MQSQEREQELMSENQQLNREKEQVCIMRGSDNIIENTISQSGVTTVT